jgi:hypothetical protein
MNAVRKQVIHADRLIEGKAIQPFPLGAIVWLVVPGVGDGNGRGQMVPASLGGI